jgi:predicted nucleic acid-binding protein
MICVDSSVVVKWLVPEDRSDQARALRRAAARSEDRLVAPVLLALEVNNVLLKKTCRLDPISSVTAATLLDRFLSSEIHLQDPAALHQDALILALDFELPAIYDAYYLALAIEARCSFWTDDQRLLRALNGRLPFVHWIGDFPL